jgi:O-antigen/teichoic acid export membrane protein
LIPPFGILGAAVGTLLAAILIAIFYYYKTTRYILVRINNENNL